MKRISDRQRQRLKEYAISRKEYLDGHKLCEKCGRTASDIHHKRGKVGSLLTNQQFFSAVCRNCHNWIHDNPNAARELGLLCEKGKWNSPN